MCGCKRNFHSLWEVLGHGHVKQNMKQQILKMKFQDYSEKIKLRRCKTGRIYNQYTDTHH